MIGLVATERLTPGGRLGVNSTRSSYATQDCFDGFLKALDPDREMAGERYEDLRHKLSRFFERRGCVYPDHYADKTLDRAMRKIDAGAVVPRVEPYCFGIARIMLLEIAAERRRQRQALEHLRLSHSPFGRGDENESLLGRLDEAMHSLPTRDRELIVAYYEGEETGKIERRRNLAARLGVSPNALRIRAHRIRRRLRKHFIAFHRASCC